jgi:outer membrane lipoprotein-sorting protein
MRKKSRISFIVVFIMLITHSLYAITGDEALNKFRARMSSIGKLTGIISWSGPEGETYTGAFKYMSPGKIYVKFSNPGGKTVVSNGRTLWVYSAGSNMCGVQDLAGGGSGGISALTSGYMAIVTAEGPGGYTIKLKGNGKTFPEIILMVDSTFFLRKAILKTQKGGVYNFSLSNVSSTDAIIPSIFDFNVPSSAQIVKNPLNIK